MTPINKPCHNLPPPPASKAKPWTDFINKTQHHGTPAKAPICNMTSLRIQKPSLPAFRQLHHLLYLPFKGPSPAGARHAACRKRWGEGKKERKEKRRVNREVGRSVLSVFFQVNRSLFGVVGGSKMAGEARFRAFLVGLGHITSTPALSGDLQPRGPGLGLGLEGFPRRLSCTW